MKVLIIGKKLYSVCLTTSAYMEICELCGSIENLKEWLGSGQAHDRLKQVISIMHEAWKRKERYQEASGLKLLEIPTEELKMPRYLNSVEIISAYSAIFEEIAQALYHEIPQNVDLKKSTEDFSYEFIMQRKAEERGVKRPNKALSVVSRGLSCGLDYETVMAAMTPGEIMQIWLYQLSAKGGKNG